MATLKISDISIGDYISYCDRVYKVHSIDGQGLIGASNDSYSSPHILKHIDYLEPIPITAEILEKNGFESTTNPNVFTLTHGVLQLYVSEELDGWYILFVNFIERLCILQVIRKSYIHELQHALRLAGIDKEITL